jgi:SpoVK/Ycf46/Vps4 family AAA+-type ATPase
LFYDIIKKTKQNNGVYDIQEYITASNTQRHQSDSNVEADMYIITQKKPILYNKELQIYAITNIEKESSDTDKRSYTTDKIIITLFSYTSTVSQILDFVNKIKHKYLEHIEQDRKGKQFIYSLRQTVKDDSENNQLWNETIFESTRTFSNMIFEGKDTILKKIDFFIHNKSWYYENGIPYTLGIGLYGPPGTGKTSFFKSLANLTGRHLVILSLKHIKTKQQLEETFFETRYNTDNKRGSIGFDKKIIIIEDIDCLGQIVWKRDASNTPPKQDLSETASATTTSMTLAIHKLIDSNNTDKKEIMEICKKPADDPITLDDILNLWDGIKETPGRILGISSNHYDKLDPALIRPGRIDITLCLDKCTRNMISEMYSRYYKKEMDTDILDQICDRFYSPAEIINFYVLHRDNPDMFIQCILDGQRVL